MELETLRSAQEFKFYIFEEDYTVNMLSDQLRSDLFDACKECIELGYHPSLFLKMMVSDKDVVRVARKLVMREEPTDGFTRLWEMKRLDLSVEAHVIQEKYKSLFTEDEIQFCKDRLEEYEYYKKNEEASVEKKELILCDDEQNLTGVRVDKDGDIEFFQRIPSGFLSYTTESCYIDKGDVLKVIKFLKDYINQK